MIIFPVKWFVLFRDGDQAIIYSDPMAWPVDYIKKIAVIRPLYE